MEAALGSAGELHYAEQQTGQEEDRGTVQREEKQPRRFHWEKSSQDHLTHPHVITVASTPAE